MYFENFKDLQELKTQYKTLCLKLHPDKGGEHEQFIKMQAEYELILESKYDFTQENAKKESNVFNKYMEAFKFLKDFNVTVELTGSWIWVSGDTRPAKELLKENNFKFSKRHSKWYYGAVVGKRKRGRYSFDKIRDTYGYESKRFSGKILIEEAA